MLSFTHSAKKSSSQKQQSHASSSPSSPTTPVSPDVTEEETKDDEKIEYTPDKIIMKIKSSKKWRILVYGVKGENESQNKYHMDLLSGILGKKIPKEQVSSSFSFTKNTVTVIVDFEHHDENAISYKDIDLLILFLPANREAFNETYANKIHEITESRGSEIWEYSVVILTGVDAVLGKMFQKDRPNNLQTLLKRYGSKIQDALASKRIQIIPVGGHDVQASNEKWFSELWCGCFLHSRVKSMPAIIKLTQRRITNQITKSNSSQLEFHEQPIQLKENSIELPQNIKLSLGIGGGSAIAGAAAVGATTGALIGALAIGIPSFGVAAGLGLLLGGIIGGGAGAGIAGAAVGGSYKMAKNKQLEKFDTTDMKLYYANLATCLPKISTYLKNWAEKQVRCEIMVTGVKGVDTGVSTLAAALTGQEPRKYGSGLYRQPIVSETATLIVHDFPGFESIVSKQQKTLELVNFFIRKHSHLLLFCVPIVSSEEFTYSKHAEFLQSLCFKLEGTSILSHIIIVLTRANELHAEKIRRNVSQMSLQEFFWMEVEELTRQIRSFLKQSIKADDSLVDKVIIIPVGKIEPTIDLSDKAHSSPVTQYHWLAELLLHALPFTKPGGLPTLIKTNQKRIMKRPNEYQDQNRVHELLIKARCSMFSSIGLKDKKHLGEAIGLVLGVNEEKIAC